MLTRAVIIFAALVAAVLAFPGLVPGTTGSLVETFRPWLGLSIPILLALAAWRRTVPTVIAAVLPLTAWLGVFGSHLVPARDVAPDLVVVQHNVSDENPDPPGTVRTLTAAGPDLIGLQEVTPEAYPAYAAAFLGTGYQHHIVHGTVALWSRHPILGTQELSIRPAAFGPDWNRGLRALTRTPHGDIAVFVVHLPSVRLHPRGFDCVRRDESARLLGAALRAEQVGRVVLLGDLNTTVDDRGLAPLTATVRPAESTFAFSYPARTPVVRIDQVMTRSLTVAKLWSLPRTGSDHLPIAAHLTV